MVSQERLQQYAALAATTGVNVQRGQLLVLTAPVEAAPFARMCAQAAYAAGAGQVQTIWTDETLARLAYEHEDTETLARIDPWQVERKRNQIDRRCCFLHIEGDTPGLLGHVDGGKLQAAALARRTAFQPFQRYTMANEGQWCVVAAATPGWAKKVFPRAGEEEAVDLLWQAILSAVRVEEGGDAAALWARHDEILDANSRRLNQYAFQALHFQNSLGTDLTVELVANHVWAGGGSTAKNGAFFNPNLPTEEVFCMPLRTGVNGVVVATKPLSYQGKLIEDFALTFQGGRVVAHRAAKGADALENLLTVDEGSAYLGEVALVPYHSPISQSGLLFLNTLFDENASCHLALGEAYPENLQGGAEMTQAQLAAAGANHSKEHCDFMFGSADLTVTGLLADGTRVAVFDRGDFSQASGFRRA